LATGTSPSTIYRCLVVEHGSRWRLEEYNEALTYYNEEAKDDNDDYVTCIFQEWKLVMAESRKFDPEEITDDEIARLGVIVSEV
jgi:hypothetical protein